MTEAALALSEQKAQDLGELLAAAEQERQSLSQRQEKERKLEQQVGAGQCALVGGWKCVTAAQPLPFSRRKLQIGSPSSSGTCRLPMKRTCCLEARYEGCGFERYGQNGDRASYPKNPWWCTRAG